MPAPHKPRRRGGDGISPTTARVAERTGLDPWLSHQQVLELLGVSKPTLWRMRQCGAFPAPIRIPGTRAVAWPTSVVRAWMDEQARTAGEGLLGP